MKIVNNISELIGNTPIIKLNKIVDNSMANVYVKLEYFNPGGSIKDRVADMMIVEAEKEGIIKPGDTIVEPTSGNTGVGLAMIGASKGYKVVLVMPDSMSMERRKILKAYGAQIVLSPGETGMNGAILLARELVEKKGYYMPKQFENICNPKAHKETTALEIINQMDSNIDFFISGVGTGGTITGVGELLKEKLNNIKIIAVEPESSAVLSGEKPGKHSIQGIGAGFIPDVLNMKIIDKVIKVSNDEAMYTAKKLASTEGIFVGISSGASVCAAIKIAKDLEKNKNILAIAPDTGERYLSLY